jgi:hypothetical protein
MSSFFEMLSSKDESTFIPSNQLVSIVTSSDQKNGSVILTFRNHPFVGNSFRVVVSTRKGSERNLARGLDSNRSKSIVLNPGTPGVIKISFHLAS